jgi:hypothetical protein
VLYGAKEKAAGIDEKGWNRINEGGWAATANGGIVEPNGMTVELGGFWRKPTDVGERLMEVPRRLKRIRVCVERGKQVFGFRRRRSDS